MKIIDIHCHVPRSPFFPGTEKWNEKWKRKNIWVCGMAMNISQSEKSLKLAKEYKQIIAGIGVHPWKVKREYTTEEYERIKQMAEEGTLIGEVGLDYRFVQKVERYPYQREFLKNILIIAGELSKPLSIHCVDAHDDFLKLIRETGIDPALISLHWYSGSEEFIKKFVSMGCYFSVNPAVEYSKAHQKVLEHVPLDRLLTESDGNVKYQGKVGVPTMVLETVLPNIGKFHSMGLEELSNQIFDNSKEFLKINFKNL